MEDIKLGLYNTDISVIKCLSVSQIVLGMVLLGISASTIAVTVHVLRYWTWLEMPLFLYAVPLELVICLVTLFTGVFGISTVRNQVRVKRQFEILTLATFTSSVLILLALAMDAIARLLELSHLDKVYAYSHTQLSRSVPFLDVMVHLVLVGILITNVPLIKTARFNAQLLGAAPATDVVHFRNENNWAKGAYPAPGPVEPLISV